VTLVVNRSCELIILIMESVEHMWETFSLIEDEGTAFDLGASLA
jgi:hypothetical protein